MHFLVTGGAGYIGSLLIPMLLERGYHVTLFDNFMWGVRSILHFATHPNLVVESGDIRDKDKIQPLVKQSDAVIHLAAIVGYPACAADPARAIAVNVEGTRNITEVMSDAQRIYFASTGSTYGKVDGVCDEDTPITPLTLYGSTKSKGEQLCLDKGGVSLRFATVFGLSPRLRLDLLVNDFVYRALHSKQIVIYEGYFRRTFMHSRDAAQSYLFAIDHYDQMAAQAYNVGDNRMNYTKKQVAQVIQKYVEFYLHEADIGEDLDKRDYKVSYDRINQLGFRTSVSLEDGIQELIQVLRHLKITDELRNA